MTNDQLKLALVAVRGAVIEERQHGAPPARQLDALCEGLQTALLAMHKDLTDSLTTGTIRGEPQHSPPTPGR
jgi:hypothetical protein